MLSYPYLEGYTAMRVLLQTLIEENELLLEEVKESVHRTYQFPDSKHIQVAIGMRRAGKSYFLYQTIHALLKQSVSATQILLINFEDDRLLPMTAKEMGKLLDMFYQIYPENHHRRCHIFLDEIQNVEDWHLTVRRYFDKKNVQLYLTGSSAKLLSKEIHTNLRGRSQTLEIWPYSFTEYLTAHHIIIESKTLGQITLDKLQKNLLDYFARGGFPAVQFMPLAQWRETLQHYVDTVILRDIVERYHVTHIDLLKYLTTTLIKNAATIFSINKFYNDIKSQGYKVSKDTLHTYLYYLEDAFLIFSVSHYSESERLKHNKPKKIYAIDIGLIHAMSLSVNELYGKLFENLIYLDLRRQHKKIYYYVTQEGFEIDFITVDPSGHCECIQVCFDDSDEKTKARENRALLAAKKELGIEGKMITIRDYLLDFGKTGSASY